MPRVGNEDAAHPHKANFASRNIRYSSKAPAQAQVLPADHAERTPSQSPAPAAKPAAKWKVKAKSA